MRGRCFFPAILLLVVGGGNPAAGQNRAVVERLIRLEEGQKALMQRLEDVDKSLGQRIEATNQRVDDLLTDMNQRFADMDKRFADLNFWLQMTFGAIFATLGVVVLQWATTIRRTTQVTERLEAHLAETEKDRLLTFQREEIELLKGRLERVEQTLQKG